MKRLILILPLFITISLCAQINYVPNYSFEYDTGLCGAFLTCGQPVEVEPWYNPTDATPDRLNPCANFPYSFGMPQNYVGYQYARTGISYAGLGADEGPPNYREYITTRLNKTLDTNKKFCVEFFVSLADSMWRASGAIGMYLSNDSICYSSSDTKLPYTPQIENPLDSILTDKVNWVPISGEYNALGGEAFITIGDFYDSTGTKYVWVGNGGKGLTGTVTYYYVDDVSVRELTIANAAISANGKKIDTICPFNSVQIGKDITTPGVSFYWSPNYNLSNANIAQPWASPSVTTTYTLTVVNDSVLALNNRGSVCNCADSVTRDSVTIVVGTCTGISKIIDNMNVKILPNPNNGNFTLSTPSISGIYEIIVYNIFGEQVFQSKINTPNTEIELKDQPVGVYFFRLTKETGDLIGNGKIVIEK